MVIACPTAVSRSKIPIRASTDRIPASGENATEVINATTPNITMWNSTATMPATW